MIVANAPTGGRQRSKAGMGSKGGGAGMKEGMKREQASRSSVYSTKAGSVSRVGGEVDASAGVPPRDCGRKTEIIFGQAEKTPCATFCATFAFFWDTFGAIGRNGGTTGIDNKIKGGVDVQRTAMKGWENREKINLNKRSLDFAGTAGWMLMSFGRVIATLWQTLARPGIF